MAMLMIDRAVKNAIKMVIDNAAKYPTKWETLKKLSKGEPAPKGRNDEFTIGIPEGFTATYTHEEYLVNDKDMVVCRHLSVSVDRKGKVPHEAAVQMIMEEYGFINKIPNLAIWPEKFGDGQTAVNVLEPLDGDMSKIMRKKEDEKWV